MKQLMPIAAVSLCLLGGPAAAQSGDSTAANVTRICLAPAAVEAAPAGAEPVAAVRDAFIGFLTGPTLAVQPLQARLQSQVRQEAKAAGCRFLLLPSVKHERKTGGGLFGKVAGGAVQQGAWAAGGSVGSTAARVVAGAAAGAAGGAVNEYASRSRNKDELTLKYRLESGQGTVLVEKSERRKATSDGEDLLTPVAQRASEGVVEAVEKQAGSNTK
jgi:hypothetical protein